MLNLENAIKEIFIEREIMLPNWKIQITDKEILGKSDYAKVTVDVFKPRKKKPEITWILTINMVREQIHWDKSEFYHK